MTHEFKGIDISLISQFYEIGCDGIIYSVSHNWRGYGRRALVYNTDIHGYAKVRLSINGVRKKYSVHKLVVLKHIGQPPSGCDQIRHIDGNKLNNNVSNLSWGNAKDNAIDRDVHGRTSKGKKHSIATLIGIYRKNNLTAARAAIIKALNQEV